MPYADYEMTKRKARESYRRNRDKRIAYAKAWKAANPERVKASYRRNRETILEKRAAYYEAHREECIARADEWARANPDRRREIRRAWDARNPDRRRNYTQARRARQRGAFIEVVEATEVYRQHDGICGICGEEVGKDFHVDHRVPLALGGEHSYANTQPAHPLCNARKGAAL